MGRQSILFAFVLGILLACQQQQNELFILFNNQNYAELREKLSDDGSWQSALLANKLATETKGEKPFAVNEIWQRFKADTLKESFALHPFYTQLKIRPLDYLKTLMLLVDSTKSIKQPEFYHSVLFQFLESKNAANRRFALDRLNSDFNFRYRYSFFETARRIQKDARLPAAYKAEIAVLANIYDVYEKESSFYDSLKLELPYKIKLSNDGFQRLGAAKSEKIEAISQINAFDLFISEDTIISDLLSKYADNVNFAYAFIQSNRKINIETPKIVNTILANKLSRNVKNRLIRQLFFIEADSALHFLQQDSLASFAKYHFFNQMDLKDYSSQKMPVLLELFRERKLQPEIEKAVKNFNKDSLSIYLTSVLNKAETRQQTYALYFTGIAGLKNLKGIVKPFLNSSDRNQRFEAEETIKRLNR